MTTSLTALTQFSNFLSAVDVKSCSAEQWLQELSSFSLLDQHLFLDKLYLRNPTSSPILLARIENKNQMTEPPQSLDLQGAASALKLGDGDLEFSVQNGHSGPYYQRSPFSHKFYCLYQLVEQENDKEQAVANMIANTSLFSIWIDALENNKRDVEPYSWALNAELKGDMFAYLDYMEVSGKYVWSNVHFKTCLANALIQRLPMALNLFPKRKEWIDTAVETWLEKNDPLTYCPHLQAITAGEWLNIGRKALDNRDVEVDPKIPLLTSLAIKAIAQADHLESELVPAFKSFTEHVLALETTPFEQINIQKIMGEKYYPHVIKPLPLPSLTPKKLPFRF